MKLKRRGRLTNEETGLGKLTAIFFGGLVLITLYIGYNVLPFFYYYFELKSQMESLIRVAPVYTNEQLREKLHYHMKQLKIPADINDVEIERAGNRIKMSLAYSETFYITYQDKDYDVMTFDFLAEEEGDSV